MASVNSTPSTSAPAAQAPILDKVKALAKTVQFYWWVGHAVLLLSSFRYLISFGTSTFYYKLAYLGNMLSYGTILYTLHKPFTPNMEKIAKLSNDLNFTYFLLALLWYSTAPFYGSLIPVIAYSVFHFTDYFRNIILPIFFPSITDELSSNSPPKSMPARLSKYLEETSRVQSQRMYQFASIAQVSMVPLAVFLNTIFMHCSILTPFLYFAIVRKLAGQCAQTRNSLAQVGQVLNNASNDPRVPAFIKRAYDYVKGPISSALKPAPMPARTN